MTVNENEVEYVDWYGQTFVPGKKNRFLLIPLHVGVQYRLFSEDIVDNFRPYLNAGFGPTLVLASPYDKEFFNSLGYSQAHYTVGGYIGIGAFFGLDKESLSGVNIRYYFIPFRKGIDSLEDLRNGYLTKKKEFGGFFITLNFGSLF
jgi:outer membrane protein W